MDSEKKKKKWRDVTRFTKSQEDEIWELYQGGVKQVDLAQRYGITQGSISVLLSRMKREKGFVWGKPDHVERPVLSESLSLFKATKPNLRSQRLLHTIATGEYSEVLFEGRLERVSRKVDTNILHNALCLETVYAKGNELNLILLPSGRMQVILTAPNQNGLKEILREQRRF